MPSRKEIQWSQLRVGALVVAATAALISLIFLMSGAGGGPFSPKLVLRSYFRNAEGLKNGAPVTLEGVTIGNVVTVRVVPQRNPIPVEVTMRVNMKYAPALHTDSTVTIAQAGVLGDSYLDISSTRATGPQPANNAELQASGVPGIQDVIHASNDSLVELQGLIQRVDKLFDTLNSKQGTAGKLINDPQLYARIGKIASNLEAITTNVADGKGSLGRLVNDDSLYTRADSAIDRLNKIVDSLDQGKGTAGKLIHDETLYNNLNAAVANTNRIVSDIDAGKGALGKLAKDPALASRMEDTVVRLDNILKEVDEGRGTMGALVHDRSLYDHSDQALEQARDLVKSIREDPKKYLVIKMKVF